MNILSPFVILVLTTYLLNTPTLATENGLNRSIPCIFTFGDSFADPGNNNYIITPLKSNFPPYGIDFSDQIPTGRFTNGRLITDLIAEYVGLKPNIPAYLDPKVGMDDLKTGVSFASAASGYDPLTATKGAVIPMSKQLENFDEYKKKLENMSGKEKMEEIVEKGMYIIIAGSIDIFYNYGIVKAPLLSITIPTYLQYLLGQFKQFLQGLKDRGARKILVLNVPPVGCLPSVITFQTLLIEPRKCVDSVSSIARQFNQLIQAEINAMQAASLPNYLVAYGDYFESLNDQFNHPQKYGFGVLDKGCCGVGAIETSVLCNPLSPICSNRTNYLFWDSIHPTQRSYDYVFQSLRPVVDMLINY